MDLEICFNDLVISDKREMEKRETKKKYSKLIK